jgi:hypothetical protein
MTASDGQDGDKRAGTGEGDAAGTGSEAPALVIIEAFGGIRPMAKHLGLAVSTVQGWKERSAIPANRHDEIRAAARNHGIAIDNALLRASASDDGAPPPVIEGQAAAAGMSAASAAAKPRDVKDPAKLRDSKDQAKTRDTKDQAKPQDAKEQGKPPGTAAPAKGRSGGFLPGLVCGAVLAVGVAAGAVYTQAYWAPLFGTGAPGGPSGGQVESFVAELARLDARLGELEGRIPADNSATLAGFSERLATLEAALSQGGGQDPDTRAALESLNGQLARLSDRIEAQDQDLADLRGRAGQPSEDVVIQLSGEAARLDRMLSTQSELAKRLTEAEAALTAAAASREAAPGSRETLLLLAALQLRDALQGSGPYDQPLKMLQNLAGEDAALAAALAPLQRRAGSGLPSLRDLQGSFPPVARRIAAIEVGEEGEGWTAGVLRRLSEAVNLRPVGLVEGTAPTAVAARAEVKLNDGDLAGALAELDTLEGAAAEASAVWRAEAEARLAGDRAVSTLGALVSERFAPLAGG